jgi:cytochrome c oxidase subunit 2
MGNFSWKRAHSLVALALLLGGPACDSNKPSRTPDSMPADAAAGLQVFTRLGCAVCHSFDNKPLAGPSLHNIYGKPVELLDGTTVLRDDTYLRTSILDSGKQVVAGFRPTMVNYGSMLQEGDLDRLLALIRFHGE